MLVPVFNSKLQHTLALTFRFSRLTRPRIRALKVCPIPSELPPTPPQSHGWFNCIVERVEPNAYYELEGPGSGTYSSYSSSTGSDEPQLEAASGHGDEDLEPALLRLGFDESANQPTEGLDVYLGLDDSEPGDQIEDDGHGRYLPVEVEPALLDADRGNANTDYMEEDGTVIFVREEKLYRTYHTRLTGECDCCYY